MQKEHKTLTNKVVKHIQKCFNYAISQNKNSPDDLSQALTAISHHPFGNHNYCKSSWCQFMKNPKAKHSSLPFGVPLTDDRLQQDLQKLMSTYQKNIKKLATLGSTQANESFNKIVATKAPKAHHFSGSANLNFRVAASVAQKNEGHQYLMKV